MPDLPVVHPDALVRVTRAFHGVLAQMSRMLPKRSANVRSELVSLGFLYLYECVTMHFLVVL